jgi:hypothetical protein
MIARERERASKRNATQKKKKEAGRIDEDFDDTASEWSDHFGIDRR